MINQIKERGGEGMGRKYFQIRMYQKDHNQLKLRAKQLGIPIGELVENLISSLEIKLNNAYKITKIRRGWLDDSLLRILLRSKLSIDEKELMEQIDNHTTQTTSAGTTTAIGEFETTITV